MILDKSSCEVCRNALGIYGTDKQICMVFEEMSELQKELCKRLRGRANREQIVEEIADVLIMLQQMILLFDAEKDVEREVGFKIDRLRMRLMGKT